MEPCRCQVRDPAYYAEIVQVTARQNHRLQPGPIQITASR